MSPRCVAPPLNQTGPLPLLPGVPSKPDIGGGARGKEGGRGGRNTIAHWSCVPVGPAHLASIMSGVVFTAFGVWLVSDCGCCLLLCCDIGAAFELDMQSTASS